MTDAETARLGPADLDDKIAEEAAVRRQRMLPLLREKATIQRLVYDHAGARETLRQMLALDPDDVVSWGELGDSWVTTGSAADALAAFRSALAAAERAAQRTPHDFDAKRLVSVSHERLGDMLAAQGGLL